MHFCPFLRYNLQNDKQKLIKALPLTVDCENNWTPSGSDSVPYSFLSIQRLEDIRSEHGFLKAYREVYSMLTEDMEAEGPQQIDEGMYYQPQGRVPPVVELQSIKF